MLQKFNLAAVSARAKHDKDARVQDTAQHLLDRACTHESSQVPCV